MKRPVAIDLWGRWIPIRYSDDLEKDGDAGRYRTLIERGGPEIELATWLPPDEQFAVLVHEIGHATLDLTGLANWLKGTRETRERNEEQFCTMLEILADIFKLDPDSPRIRWEEV